MGRGSEIIKKVVARVEAIKQSTTDDLKGKEMNMMLKFLLVLTQQLQKKHRLGMFVAP